MKARLPGFSIVVLIIIFCLAAPGWSQDTAQSSAQEPAQSSTMDAAQPTTQEAAQPTTQEATQPSTQAGDQSSSQMDDQSGVHLAEAVVCQDVVDRSPVGAGDVFAREVPKVYCFTRVVGGEGTQLTYNWYYKGSLKASVKLDVRSPNYRTWSSKTMLPEWSGEWMVEILSGEGKPLESIIFYLK